MRKHCGTSWRRLPEWRTVRSEAARDRSSSVVRRAARRLHPLTLLFDAVEAGQGFVFPAILGGVWAGGGHMARMMGWMFALLVIPSVLWAVAEYVAFRYRLQETELVLDFGVVRRNHRTIPLSRVQSIDLRQNPLQRLLGVAALHIETGGGKDAEAMLSVVSTSDARNLRAAILSLRGGGERENVQETPRILARLSRREVAYAGATSNHAGIIAGLLVGVLQLIYELGWWQTTGLDLRLVFADRSVGELYLTGLLFVAVALPFAWALSVAGALVRYHGFITERMGEEVRTRSGYLARREVTVPLRRVQAVRVRESLLRRPLGLAALEIETAGASPGGSEDRAVEAYVPLTRSYEVARLVGAVLPGLDYAALDFHSTHPLALQRTFVRYAAALIGVAAVLAYTSGPTWAWLAGLTPLAWIAAALHVRHAGYAFDPAYLAIRSGFLTRTTWLVPRARVQTMHLHENTAQRRFGLATLVVDTAAGQTRVVDLAVSEGTAVLDSISRRLGSRCRL